MKLLQELPDATNATAYFNATAISGCKLLQELPDATKCCAD
jgi:hypothetical protein